MGGVVNRHDARVFLEQLQLPCSSPGGPTCSDVLRIIERLQEATRLLWRRVDGRASARVVDELEAWTSRLEGYRLDALSGACRAVTGDLLQGTTPQGPRVPDVMTLLDLAHRLGLSDREKEALQGWVTDGRGGQGREHVPDLDLDIDLPLALRVLLPPCGEEGAS